jgi:RNA polymerase sigma-70 factor, ECF subfamily
LSKAELYLKSSNILPQNEAISAREEHAHINQSMLPAEMTAAEVISRAQAGDMRCFEILYARHKRRVFSLCFRMTGNYAEAEDFTQEAFLQLYRKIGSFRGESAFSTWLHRLSVNIVLMHFRKKTRCEVSLEEMLEPQQREEGPTREFGMTDNILHGSVDRITLERAIGGLPPGYRIIFVLHDIEGYEHNEIAEMLGCSIGNSKSQLHKARMKLRTLLPFNRKTKTAGQIPSGCSLPSADLVSRELDASLQSA